MKQFTAVVIFGTWDKATSATQALYAAGYGTQILDDVDLYSPATWMDVWRPSEAGGFDDPRFDLEIKQLDAILKPLGGFSDDFCLVEDYQPRESFYPATMDAGGGLHPFSRRIPALIARWHHVF
jgi:hypothetical protein